MYPNVLMQVICMSYAGEMHMAFTHDVSLPKPELIPEFYLDELRALKEHFRA
jgi:hypothetical protein